MSAANPKLSRRTKLLFSTGDLSTSIPLAILMFFQLYFMTDVAGLRHDRIDVVKGFWVNTEISIGESNDLASCHGSTTVP